MTDPVRRVRYFDGQRLSADDLQAEQDYHRRMRYLHNRLLGHGVVDGLNVTPDVGDSDGDGDGDDGATVVVSPGLAIDGFGRELVLTDEVRLTLPSADPECSYDVVATWAEELDGPVVALTQDLDPDVDEPAYSRWLERPRVTLERPGQSPPDSVILGRITPTAQGVGEIDLSTRSRWRRARHHEEGDHR